MSLASSIYVCLCPGLLLSDCTANLFPSMARTGERLCTWTTPVSTRECGETLPSNDTPIYLLISSHDRPQHLSLEQQRARRTGGSALSGSGETAVRNRQ